MTNSNKRDLSLVWTIRFLKILKICIICGVVVVVRLNVPPYINGLRQVFEDNAVDGFLASIPFIGWIFSAMGAIAIAVGGVILWATFQGFEVLPAVILGNRAAVKMLANNSKAYDELSISDNDTGSTAWLKKIYNNLPFAWMRKMKLFQAGSYLGDLLFVTTFYPPLSVGGVSFQNLAMVITLLFSFQVAIGLYAMVCQIEKTLSTKEIKLRGLTYNARRTVRHGLPNRKNSKH